MKIQYKDNDGNITTETITDTTPVIDTNDINDRILVLKSKLINDTITTKEKEELTILTNGNEGEVIDNFWLNLAKNNYPGHYILRKFGRNLDLDGNTMPEDIWEGGGKYTGHNIDAAKPLVVFSSSDEDGIEGSGATAICIKGLDENYNRIEEILTLTGTTPVTTIKSYMRQDTATIINALSTGANVGTITAHQQDGPTLITMKMAPGTNKTHICCLTVPAGETAYLVNFGLSTKRASSAGTNAGEFDIMSRKVGEVFVSNSPFECSMAGGLVNFDVKMGMKFIEKSDVSMRCFGIDPNNTVASGYFTIIFVKNS